MCDDDPIHRPPTTRGNGIRSWISKYWRICTLAFPVLSYGFIEGPTYIESYRKWSNIAKSTDHADSTKQKYAGEAPATGSIKKLTELPCVDAGELSQTLRNAEKNFFGAQRDIFNSRYAGRNLCAPGWPLIFPKPVRDSTSSAWILEMRVSNASRLSVRLEVSDDAFAVEPERLISVAGRLASISEYGTVKIEDPIISPRAPAVRKRTTVEPRKSLESQSDPTPTLLDRIFPPRLEP